ncbi:MAG: hypothetical protein QM621_10230 [Aeromicrobium sp.]|uniref:hypothetical protein n=1 Tax=Aeromicrobium sp. TaxID=1871063 RepID=UPI0039E42FA1
MSDDAPLPGLDDQARRFATDLTTMLHTVLGDGVPGFISEASPVTDKPQRRVIVKTIDDQEIPLRVDGVEALQLIAKFTCEWDHQDAYLAVRTSEFHVRSAGSRSNEPLFRYEFVDAMQSVLPSAHLHVHAHRDETLFQLFRSTTSKRAQSRARKALDHHLTSPRLSDIHFPLGGPLMRPGLEDVLGLLITEFCVDTVKGAEEALTQGRLHWRRQQVGALVREAPEQAVRVLREMGYDVRWPDSKNPEPCERTERLARP